MFEMDLTDQIVPALVLLASNLMSGRHGSPRYEGWTAVFGWITAATFLAAVVVTAVAPQSLIKAYLYQISGFCLLTALSRDYEKILRPLFPWNR
jgi:hypothetical protein